MFKKIYFIFYFIFFISLTSAVTLSMSPPQIDFLGKTGEKLCADVTITTDGFYEVLGEDLWAQEGYFERKLSSHKLPSENLSLEINYPKQTIVNNKTLAEVCIKGKNQGNFHGLLLYQVKDKPIKIGIWINVSLEKNDILKITGHSINVTKEFVKSNSLIVIAFVLFVVFLLLVFRLKGK